jgi:hypothetical protein
MENGEEMIDILNHFTTLDCVISKEKRMKHNTKNSKAYLILHPISFQNPTRPAPISFFSLYFR